MKSWNIEFSRQMYDSLANMFRLIGLQPPAYITSEDIEKALVQMNSLIQKKNTQVHASVSLQTPVPHANKNFNINNDKLIPQNQVLDNATSKRALIISKVGIIRYQLKNIFASKKFQVTTIDNPFSGLAEYVKKLYDVVIIDVNDNIQDAITVLHEIKSHSNHNNVKTRIILLTPQNSKLNENRDIAELVDQFIIKTENWYTNFSRTAKAQQRHLN